MNKYYLIVGAVACLLCHEAKATDADAKGNLALLGITNPSADELANYKQAGNADKIKAYRAEKAKPGGAGLTFKDYMAGKKAKVVTPAVKPAPVSAPKEQTPPPVPPRDEEEIAQKMAEDAAPAKPGEAPPVPSHEEKPAAAVPPQVPTPPHVAGAAVPPQAPPPPPVGKPVAIPAKPASVVPMAPASPAPSKAVAKPEAPQGGMSSALQEQIKTGKTLKPVDKEKLAAKEKARSKAAKAGAAKETQQNLIAEQMAKRRQNMKPKKDRKKETDS
jgi:hypothetical protein